MAKLISILLTFISLNGFSQSIETITEKVSNKICECINDRIKSYEEIKPEFNRCYDQVFNQIFNLVDSSEQKLLLGREALKKVSDNIIPTLNLNCEKIKKIIKTNLENASETFSENSDKSFPTNFEAKDFTNIDKWVNKIVAFDGDIIRTERSRQNTPYFEIKIENKNIWVVSMINTGFEKVNSKVRIIGYLIEIDTNDNKFERNIHNEKYHVLAFGILDLKSKNLTYFPGAEQQIKEWIHGKIPIEK